MEKQKPIKKNVLMNFILALSNFVFPLITFSYVARVLMPDGLGSVAFVQSVLSYFSYAAVLGIPAYGLRECAKIRDDKEKLSHTVQELILINLISAFISYLCFIGSLFLVPRFWQNRMLFFIMSSGIILKILGVEWLYQALEEYSYITIRSLIVKCISVVLTFILIRERDDYIWYGVLTIFGSSASNICNFLRVRKYISFKKVFGYDLHRHLKPMLSLFSASIIVSIYANFDVVMIGIIKNDNEVGLYNAALKIKNIVLIASTAVTDVLISRVAYYYSHKENERIKNLSVKTMKSAMLLSVPIAVYILLYAENVLLFVCGKEYVEAVSTLRILACCVFPLITTYIFGQQLLIPMGLEKRYSQSVFVGLWINLILNLLMIPSMGAFGAAIGTFVTECWNVYWMSGGVKEYRKYILKKTGFFRYFFALAFSASMSLVIHYIMPNFNVFVQLVITSLVFFGIYYLILLCSGESILLETMLSLKSKLMKWAERK